jgi:hypothetical protein
MPGDKDLERAILARKQEEARLEESRTEESRQAQLKFEESESACKDKLHEISVLVSEMSGGLMTVEFSQRRVGSACNFTLSFNSSLGQLSQLSSKTDTKWNEWSSSHGDSVSFAGETRRETYFSIQDGKTGYLTRSQEYGETRRATGPESWAFSEERNLDQFIVRLKEFLLSKISNR